MGSSFSSAFDNVKDTCSKLDCRKCRRKPFDYRTDVALGKQKTGGDDKKKKVKDGAGPGAAAGIVGADTKGLIQHDDDVPLVS